MINRRIFMAGLAGGTLSTAGLAESGTGYIPVPIYLIRNSNYGVNYFLELAKDLNKEGIEVYNPDPLLWDTFVEATYKINGDFKITRAMLDKNGIQVGKFFNTGNLNSFNSNFFIDNQQMI